MNTPAPPSPSPGSHPGPPSSPPGRPRTEAIFDAALDLPETERADFVAAECAGDQGLEKRIHALLGVDAKAPDFLEEPPIGADLNGIKPMESGSMVGPYKLREQIGEGGFGSVWVAEQEHPVRRRVALKIIKMGMDTKEVIARFEQERQALAMMDHPNIAKVLDAGATDQGRPFFVMELVKGMPITQYCDQAGLATRARLALFGDVCSAINHAHQKGVIHRDIKPSNVMVTLHGEKPVVKVIDFGIAKATQGRLTDHTVYTQFQQMVGTPAYMSPEQAGMSGLDVDTRSDIYALGVLLYELLVGRPPFDGKSLAEAGYEEMRRIIREVEPVKPSSRLSTITKEDRTQLAKARRIEPEKIGKLVEPDLDWIVMKAIDKDRTRRYETANAFAQDIARFLADEPVSATPPSAGYRFQKLVRRHRTAIRIAASIAVLLVAATIISSWLAMQANRARAAAESERQMAQAEAARANEAEKREEQLRIAAQHERAEARRRSYAADMLLCRQALKANNLREARQSLDRQRPAESEEDLRGWEWRWLWSACRSGALYDLGEQKTRALQAIYVDSGRSIVTYEIRGAVRLINLDGRRTETLCETPESSTLSLPSNSGLMTASQDRRWIAAVGQKGTVYHVRVWDRLKNTAPREIEVGRERVSAIAISPDGATLVTYAPNENAASIWDLNHLDSSQPRRIALKLTRRIVGAFGAVRFSPDGKMLAVGGVGGEIRLMRTAPRIEDWTDQGTIMIDQVQNLGVAALDFSPDGRLIACGRMFIDPRVFIADVETLKTIRVLPGHTGFVAGVAFSPDGKLLATASADQTVKVWDVETWNERGTHLGHTDEVWSVDFSPDSQRLISGGKDRRIEVWPATTFPDRDGSSLAAGPNPHFSPDGRKMLFIADGVVKLAGDAVPMVPAELGTDILRAFWTGPEQIVALSRTPDQIRMWNLATSQIETLPQECPADAGVNCEYLPLSHLLVFTLWNKEGEDATVVRWDIATRRQLSSHALPIAKAIRNMPARSSLDGRWMAVPQWDSVAIYDIENGTLATTLAVPSKAGIQGLAVSPDGKQLAVAQRDEPAIMIMDVATSHTVATLRGHNLVLTRLEYSPDGTRLLSSTIGSEAVKVWNAESWMEVARFEPPSGVYYAGPGFTSDGSTIVVGAFRFGGGWNTARLFRAPSWEEIAASEAKEEPQRPSNTINQNK